MEEKIIGILKETLETPSINADSNQQNTEKWDSLNQLNIVVALEDAFDVTLEPEEIAEMKSVTDIVRILSAKK